MSVQALSTRLCEPVIQLAMALASIPSPTGREGDKAAFVRDWFAKECGVAAAIDSVGNVVLEFPGRPGNTTQLVPGAYRHRLSQCGRHHAAPGGKPHLRPFHWGQ